MTTPTLDARVWTYTNGPRNGPPRFDLLKPDPTAIHALDLAHGLAGKWRFYGQAPRRKTVARHSIEVADLVGLSIDPDDPLYNRLVFWALCHDAPEAYLGDIPRPYRASCAIRSPRGWHPIPAIEAGLLEAISAAFMVEGPELVEHDAIKRADNACLAADCCDGWIYAGDQAAYPADDADDWLSEFSRRLAHCLARD